MREKRINYFIRNGFFKSEAIQLSRTSKSGMKAPYFMSMVRSRRRTWENAKRNNWTEKKYRDYIKKQYLDKGFVKSDKLGRKRVDVWALLRDFEERAFRRGEEYESPWIKKTKRKSTTKKTVKRTTRRDMLKSWIANLNKTISRTTSEKKKKQLMKSKKK